MRNMLEPWAIYAFAGFMGYFFVNFLFKYVSKESPYMVSLILYGAAAVSMFLVLSGKMDFSISARSAMIAVLIGIFSVTATVFAIKSINLAPNPGYSVAIYSANFVLLAVVSVFAFGSELTFVKFLGIAATFLGLILLSI